MTTSSWLDWKETNEADKIDYYNDRKHGIIEIFVRVKLPYKFYEIASGISILYNRKSFDDYVSELVYEDIERLLDGPEIIGDLIMNKITGEKTDWHIEEEEKSQSDMIELPPSKQEEKEEGEQEKI